MTFEQLIELAKEHEDWEEWSGLLYLEAIEALATLEPDRARQWVTGVRDKYRREQRVGGGDRRWVRARR